MKTGSGSVCRTTPKTKSERLICSGRSARRTAYRCRFDYGRTYDGEEIDDDPAVCLECTIPAGSCHGDEQCYLRQKARRENRKTETAQRLLDKWKPNGIYDIWGESL